MKFGSLWNVDMVIGLMGSQCNCMHCSWRVSEGRLWNPFTRMKIILYVTFIY